MLRNFTVRRDQAVWESEYFIVQVEDSVTDDHLREAIEEILFCEPEHLGRILQTGLTRILDSVESLDVQITIYNEMGEQVV